MPRLYGDQLVTRGPQLVDSIDRDNRVANEVLYKRWIPAYDWQWSSGMADFGQIGTLSYAAKMGKPSGLITVLRAEELWVKGTLYVTIYYSGDSNSGDYAASVSALPLVADGLLDAAGSSVSATLAAPSAANALSTATVNGFAVDANDKVLMLKVERVTSGDTNSGTMYFVGAMTQFYPDRRL